MGQGGRQQDSHELLRCLLGGIQAEDEAAAKRLHPNQIDEVLSFVAELSTVVNDWRCSSLAQSLAALREHYLCDLLHT